MTLSPAVLNQLRNDFDGEVITSRDDGYELAHRVWNAAVDAHPTLIVRPGSARGVCSAVRFANHYQLPLVVRGGGYDWAGRSMRTGSVVIDLANISNVSIDSHSNVASIGGGAKGKEVLMRAGEYGLVAVAGAVGAVGMTGFTLSGGYGPLTPGLGLGVDNLLSAELVLADGTVASANEAGSPDLLWAPRGGGGNFGVVTSLDLRLHPVAEVVAGKALYSWPRAVDLLQSYGRHMADAPDSLAATIALVTSPEGELAVALAPCLQGPRRRDGILIENLIGIGDPIVAQNCAHETTRAVLAIRGQRKTRQALCPTDQMDPGTGTGCCASSGRGSRGENIALLRHRDPILSRPTHKNSLGRDCVLNTSPALSCQYRGGLGREQLRGRSEKPRVGFSNLEHSCALLLARRLCEPPRSGREGAT